MNQNPYDPNNPGTSQQVPPYTPPPPGYHQPPPGAYQQVPPGYNPYGAPVGMQQKLPNATGALVCGILGILFSLGIFGVALNIIAISLGVKAINKYKMNPGLYTEASLSQAKAGRTCGIIGLCLLPVGVLIIIDANS